MKRFLNWQLVLGLLLIVLSAFVYYIHFLLFRDAHHIFLYLVGDIAFVFIEVLMVTLVLHRLLQYREKQAILKKLNMVIGTFFTEVGQDLIKMLSSFNPDCQEIARKLIVNNNWLGKEFTATQREIKDKNCNIVMDLGDIKKVRDFLIAKRDFLLRLLGNPNLLEHERFTDLLWAVFHLTEELIRRKNLDAIPDMDRKHLEGDIKRAYIQLVFEWVAYMMHLKNDYPYLFSLAVRTNPFDSNASVELK